MILVTGAGGAVGTALLAALRGSGTPHRAAYHNPAAAERDRAAGHHATTVDLSDPATLPPALSGVDAVFLLGAMSPHQTTQELNAVRAATAAGVRRVVKLSVWRADEELTPIARLHRPVERALEESTLSWTFLRPNFYLDNFTRQYAPAIRATGTFAQPAADAPISFISTSDIARTAAHVLTTPGHDAQIYDLTGPEALTYVQAADILTTVLDRPIRYVGLSDDEARAALLARGVPSFYADALIDVARAYRHGGADTVTSTVQDLTGRPPTSFADFIRAHRDVFA